MSVLLELLSNAISDGQAALPDHDVRLHVTSSLGSMEITSDLGELVVEGRALVIGPASATLATSADEDGDARWGAV
jgi:anti-sigma regulatory factor (Ser/Thr protein kinase)